MSMLTAQVDELHTASTWVSLYLAGATNAIPMNTAILLRDAADTIENLRGQLTEQTCQDAGNGKLFQCSECGSELAAVFMIRKRPLAGCPWPQYCPECGRKVIR